MNFSWTGKKVWITGASSGIGAELAKQCIAKGAIVAVSARNEAAMKALYGSSALILPCDLENENERTAVLQKIHAAWGTPDVLILNAGISQKSRALDTDTFVEHTLMEVNYFANVHLAKAIAESMKMVDNKGHIAVVSSIIGRFGAPFLSTYAASKHAINGFFESLRYEVHENGIKIQILTPGFIKTGITPKSLTGNGSPFNEDSAAQEKGIPAHKCASKMLNAIAKGRKHVYIGRLELLFPLIHTLTPNLFYWLLKKLHKL